MFVLPHQVKGIADIFKADEQKGLLGDDDDLLKRRNAFGSNTYPRKKGWSFWNFVWDAFYDITLLILIIAAAASLCLGVKSEVSIEWSLSLYKTFQDCNCSRILYPL
ncbi:Calcium-transporting ATPase 10, plasma membrane-type [Camellia lanceoleosa]|uniref:Calcium-transporting ATPase 10, plasma membrane-type n=1 Tax=Camellia lanceoleosa TaxID=1840588 RepID=A0ACC0IZX3_9ERIC|nr:Calcium-transporting ATPase 10, plasma membrane-type [Camellia lanceoleosa]